MKTVEHLFEASGLSVAEVAARSGLDEGVIEAVAAGRRTPSPDERSRIAAAFGVEVGDVSWGHSMNPRNVRYGRFGLKENF